MAEIADKLRVDQRAALRAVGAATQWRLLLLWVGLLLIPTVVASVPVWRALSALLDHSVHAAEWARHFDALAFGDTLTALSPMSAALGAGVLLSGVLTVLLSPFLNGMAVGSALAGRRLGFGHLLQCGVVEYSRMFRLLLWALPLYAAAFMLAGAASALADKFVARAVLESRADMLSHWALAASIVVFLIVPVVMAASRAAFMADPMLRSATRAFGRGWLMLLRRPCSTLGWFVGVSVIGYAVAFALGVVRISLPKGDMPALLLGIGVTQLIALAMGWTHIARMFALRTVALSLPPRRKARPAPPELAPAAA